MNCTGPVIIWSKQLNQHDSYFSAFFEKSEARNSKRFDRLTVLSEPVESLKVERVEGQYQTADIQITENLLLSTHF